MNEETFEKIDKKENSQYDSKMVKQSMNKRMDEFRGRSQDWPLTVFLTLLFLIARFRNSLNQCSRKKIKASRGDSSLSEDSDMMRPHVTTLAAMVTFHRAGSGHTRRLEHNARLWRRYMVFLHKSLRRGRGRRSREKRRGWRRKMMDNVRRKAR